MDFIELDDNVPEAAECPGIEEERGWIYLVHEGFLALGHHRRELLDVAYHQELDPAEWLVVSPVALQCRIYRVQDVGPDHRDFVNDEELQRAEYFHPVLSHGTVFLRHLVFCHKFLDIREIWAEGELEEGVYGDASGIDGGHSCRGHHCEPFPAVLHDMLQEGGLAGSCLACQEHGNPGLLYVPLSQQEAAVFLDSPSHFCQFCLVSGRLFRAASHLVCISHSFPDSVLAQHRKLMIVCGNIKFFPEIFLSPRDND